MRPLATLTGRHDRHTDPNCTHPITIDDQVAGLKCRRCVECDHISIHHVREGPTGTLFIAPRPADH